MTNPAYIPQGTAPDWIKIADNGMWSMVGDAVKQDKVNQETAAFNKQLADMFQQQSQQMHPLKMQAEAANINQSNAAADYSRQLTATSADTLAAQPPAPARQKAAEEKLTAEQAKTRYEKAKVAMGELAHWATAFETGGLQAIMEAPEPIRQKMVQPGVAKQVLAQAKLMAQYDPEYMKAIKLQEMREAGDTSRNNANIAAQKERDLARQSSKKVDRLKTVEDQIVKGTNAYSAAIRGASIIESMIEDIDPQDTKTIEKLNAEKDRYEKIAELAKQREIETIVRKAQEAALAQGTAVGARIGAAKDSVAQGTPSPLKPNPAVDDGRNKTKESRLKDPAELQSWKDKARKLNPGMTEEEIMQIARQKGYAK